jgi:FkbM family methyltransferase
MKEKTEPDGFVTRDSDRKLNFIQIGANVGKTPADIMWKIVRYYNWSGIFVEPLPSSFVKLVENYDDLTNCTFENIAVSDYDGEINIYSDCRSKYENQQASTKQTHWEANQINLVICVKLETLIRGYGHAEKEFDLLQIDTEGDDGKIILSTDFNVVCPREIRFEQVHLEQETLEQVKEHLISFGYKEVEDKYGHLVQHGEIGYDLFFEKHFEIQEALGGTHDQRGD